MRSQRVSPFCLPSIHQISTLEKTKFYQRSILSSLMSVRIQRVSPFYNAAQFAGLEKIDFRVWFSRGFLMQWKVAHQESFRQDQIHHRLRFCCDSFFTCIVLRSFRHHFKTSGRTELANVEQTQKMIPFITCQISLGQYVCELVFGVNVFDLDLGVQIDSIEHPIKSNSVGSGDMSHCRASSLYIILITASLSSNTYNKASR